MFDGKLANALVALLTEKVNLTREIENVTASQTAFIENEEIQPLLDCIEKRQNLIDRINGIDAEVAIVAKEMGEPDGSAQWTELREALRRINGEIHALLLAVDERDKLNERAATNKIMSYQKDIQTLNQGVRSVNAYSAPPPSTEGIYIDKKN